MRIKKKLLNQIIQEEITEYITEIGLQFTGPMTAISYLQQKLDLYNKNNLSEKEKSIEKKLAQIKNNEGSAANLCHDKKQELIDILNQELMRLQHKRPKTKWN